MHSYMCACKSYKTRNNNRKEHINKVKGFVSGGTMSYFPPYFLLRFYYFVLLNKAHRVPRSSLTIL